MTNGDQRPNPRQLVVPPQQAVSIGGESQLDWEPSQRSILWVNSLDVPPGVLVANRVQTFIFVRDHPETPCTGKTNRYAGLLLPVFGSLIPAGTPQYFLGTDVGSRPSNLGIIDSRLNVGVFNGGTAMGTASIKIYCGAPGADPGFFQNTLLATKSFPVPPNTIVQQTVLPSTAAAACPTAGSSFWYATATVDQPSFAYAIGLANGTPPTFQAPLR